MIISSLNESLNSFDKLESKIKVTKVDVEDQLLLFLYEWWLMTS
jgi:hypothetical protein